EFLVEMALHSSSRDQAEFATLIKILGEQRALRKIAMTAATISERACESGASPSELAEQLLGAAEFGRTNTEPLKRLGEHVDEMDQAVTSEIPTGLKCIDRVIGGWQSG